MTIPLKKYLKIKNNYCISYYGPNKEYITQLKLLRPLIEKEFPELNLYICVNKNNLYVLKGEKNFFSKEDLVTRKKDISYIREIKSEIKFHAIENLLEESKIEIKPILKTVKNNNHGKAGIITKGVFPNRPLNSTQIIKAENFIKEKKCVPLLNPEINDKLDFIIGVENEITYEIAALGVKTYLVPTGNGENLFLKMFPSNEILNL